MQERQPCLLQNLHVELCIHDPIKDTDPSGTSHTDASPDVTWTFTECLALYQESKESKINCHCIMQNVTGREQVSEKYAATMYVCLQVHLHVLYIPNVRGIHVYVQFM